MKLFLQKNAKISSAGGFAPRPHWPLAAGGSAPRPPKYPPPPPPLQISGYAPASRGDSLCFRPTKQMQISLLFKNTRNYKYHCGSGLFYMFVFNKTKFSLTNCYFFYNNMTRVRVEPRSCDQKLRLYSISHTADKQRITSICFITFCAIRF